MLPNIDVEWLIHRLQDHALADAPGTMSEPQVAAALALLDRTLPDLHEIVLNDGRLEVVFEAAQTHISWGHSGSPRRNRFEKSHAPDT